MLAKSRNFGFVRGGQRETVEFFGDLGIGGDRAVKLITKAPAVLSLSLERNIVPTIDFLADESPTASACIKCIETGPTLGVLAGAQAEAHGQVFVDEFFPACDVRCGSARQLQPQGRIIPGFDTKGREHDVEQALHKPSYVVCMRDDQFQKSRA